MALNYPGFSPENVDGQIYFYRVLKCILELEGCRAYDSRWIEVD